MNSRRSLGLPLLTKELIEQSARPRTYVLRSVYALLLSGITLLIFWGTVYSDSTSPFDVLGQGEHLFTTLLWLQTIGVLLFTPALTCGAITAEKERNTFGLLLLTRLGPWTILLEKYLGRVIIMGTYLLIALPLFGFCYALGGLEQAHVWAGFYALVVTVLQLTALGLFCSAFFRTTVASLIGTYLLGIALFFMPMMLIEGFHSQLAYRAIEILWQAVSSGFSVSAALGETAIRSVFHAVGMEVMRDVRFDWNLFASDDHVLLTMPLFAPGLMMEAINRPFIPVPLWGMIARGVPALGSGAMLFLLARVFLIRRAFALPRNLLMRFFRKLDGLYERLNQNRVTQGIVLVGEKNSLPGDDPVAWRETTKTSLGTVRYLVRIFLVLEFPVLFLCILSMISPAGTARHPAVAFVNLICWVAAVLLTVIKGATLIAEERSRETLDVLLSTPLRSEDLVRQKFKGVWRLLIVVSIPLLTGILTQGWYASLNQRHAYYPMRFGGGRIEFPEESAALYLFVGLSSVLLSLPLIAWLSFLIGLRMKTSTRAIFASLAAVLSWIILPFPVLISLFEAFHVPQGHPWTMTLLVSPAAVPAFSEMRHLDNLGRSLWLTAILNLILYGALLYVVRRMALKQAARCLGRVEVSPEPAGRVTFLNAHRQR